MLVPHPPFEIPRAITIFADADFETYSEGGYQWNPPAPPNVVWRQNKNWKEPRLGVVQDLGSWGHLPGLSGKNKGLTAVGAWNYVSHPSFQPLSLAYDLKDGRGRRWWRPDGPNPRDLLEHVARGRKLEAWNVFFEWCVWNIYCVPKLGWPPLRIEQCEDAMAKSRASAYPGKLEDAGVVLQLPAHLQKDEAGAALIKTLTVPRNPTKGNPALRVTPFMAPAEFERFYKYNEQDIVAEAAISARLPDLTPREHEIWQFDFRRNARGMFIGTADVENCIAIVEQAWAKYNASLSRITDGAAKNSTEVAKILAWMLRTHSIRLDDLDEETVEESLGRPYPQPVLDVLRIRQLLAFGSVRKLFAMRSHVCSDGRLRDQYVYYGAHTGLWNGRAVQPANLYKGAFNHPDQVAIALSVIASRSLETVEAAYGDALEVVASCLRSMIRAAPGHKLISADFSALQAVVTAALAGEEWRLEVFRTHGMIYEAQASKLTGKPLQFYIDYKKQFHAHHPDRQDWGKLPVLSGDFAAWIAGWKRFGAEKILGDDANIKAAILKLRDSIPNIVEYWGGQTRNKFKREQYSGDPNAERPELYGLEGAAISAVLSPGQCFGYRGVRYQMHEDTLCCMPPSGGLIRYHTPRLGPSYREYASPWELELSYMGWSSTAGKGKGKAGWKQQKLYAGPCTQNVTSHEAREIQCDALVALDTHEPRPYPIVMDTHDEQVAEVPDREEYNAAEYTRIVRDSLAGWAKTPDGRPWPVKVPEAWEAYLYGKWEL